MQENSIFIDKNTDIDTKNFEECDGLDILASY